MDIFILIILSAVAMLGLGPVSKATKVPVVIYFMILGVIIGSYGLNLVQYLPSISVYSSVAIVILFLVSGYGLNVPAIKTSGKRTFALSSLPAIGEGLLAGVIAWVVLTIIPVFDEPSINMAAVVAIMLVFAMSSPAIIIPFNMQGKGRGINSPAFDELTVASVLDNFIPFPICLVLLNLAYAIESGDGVNILAIIVQSAILIIAIVVAFIITYLIGKGVAKATGKINNSMTVAIIATLITVLVYFITGPIGASLGIIMGFGIGVGYNVSAKQEIKMPMLGASQKIYGLLLMPMVFIYVGTQIQIDQLLRPATVIAFTIITIIAIFLKGFVAKAYLTRNGYSKEEGQYVAYGFAAKGIILINISLVIGVGLTNNGLDYMLQMMYMLAAISIIISVPYSSVKLGKQLDVLEETNKEQ